MPQAMYRQPDVWGTDEFKLCKSRDGEVRWKEALALFLLDTSSCVLYYVN